MSHRQAWHAQYDDPTSWLTRRLQVVRARLDASLDSVDTARPRLLALCAGDARDVIPVLRSRPDGRRVAAVLVEGDEVLAERARAAAQVAGLPDLEVRRADAGDVRSFRDVLPVDVLMLCGIFGNIDRPMVRHVVSQVPAIVTSGGFVIWTRGAKGADDPRAEVRRWFVDEGMTEMSFDGPPENYRVGVNRVVASRPGELDGGRLFSFVEPGGESSPPPARRWRRSSPTSWPAGSARPRTATRARPCR
jgi:hypothetical protein